jgi:hypothetical protein
MNTYGRIELGGRGKLLLAGPFVLIAILAGIGLLAADPDQGLRPSPAPATAVAEDGPSGRPSPAQPAVIAVASPSARRDAYQCPSASAGLSPGQHRLPVQPLWGRLALMLTLGDGWCHLVATPLTWTDRTWTAWNAELGSIGFLVANDPLCDSLPKTLTQTVSIDRRTAQRTTYWPGSDCQPNLVLDALDHPGGRSSGSVVTVWQLNVGGLPIVLYAVTDGSDPEDREALRGIVESVSLEPVERILSFSDEGPAAIANESCAFANYRSCRDDVIQAMANAPGSLVALCEYDPSAGAIVMIGSPEDAEAACSKHGRIPSGRLVVVLRLP